MILVKPLTKVCRTEELDSTALHDLNLNSHRRVRGDSGILWLRDCRRASLAGDTRQPSHSRLVAFTE
jgi:hypothetical protein